MQCIFILYLLHLRGIRNLQLSSIYNRRSIFLLSWIGWNFCVTNWSFQIFKFNLYISLKWDKLPRSNMHRISGYFLLFYRYNAFQKPIILDLIWTHSYRYVTIITVYKTMWGINFHFIFFFNSKYIQQYNYHLELIS